MKKLFSLVLIFLFLLIISQQGLIILHFKLNQQAIEQEFCENKSKPELECHGKCYLKKELKQSEKNNLETSIIFKNIEIVLTSNFEYKLKIFQIKKNRKKLIYKELCQSEPHLKIFTPPPNFKPYLPVI